MTADRARPGGPARPADARRAHYDDPAAVERAALALDAGRMGAWAWDIGMGTVTGDPFIARLLNLDHDAQPWPLDAVFASMHPDDLARVQREVDRALTDGAPYEVVFRDRIIDPDTGEPGLRWLGARGTVTDRASDGTPRRMIGVNWDATPEMDQKARLRALADEIDHRMRNALSSLRAIVALGEATASGTPELAATLRATLLALGHVHGAAGRRADPELPGGERTVGAVLERVVASWPDRAHLRIREDVALAPYRGTAMATLIAALKEIGEARGTFEANGRTEIEIGRPNGDRADGGRLHMTWRIAGSSDASRPFADALLERAVDALDGRLARTVDGGAVVYDMDLSVS